MSQFPPDIIVAICAAVYNYGLPASPPSLDPLLCTDTNSIPTGLPSSLPPSNWPEPVVRRTLASLCLVDHAWCAGAKPWLWRKVEVRLPHSWLSIVNAVAWDVSGQDTVEQAVGASIKAAADIALASGRIMGSRAQKQATFDELEEGILEKLSAPDSAIPLELLSPFASREPSPRRFRTKSKSPARWKIMKSVSDAIRNLVQNHDPGVYVPTPEDPRPGRYIQHLDFNHFRTIGMRRSVEEGVNSRFVTGERVQAILKEMNNLTVFGATEYMDGALTLPVLKELFLRGPPSCGRGRPSRGRGFNTVDSNDAEEEDRGRRRDCKELEAVDLTGCVSAVFVTALAEFVTTQLLPAVSSDESSSEEESHPPRSTRRARFARVVEQEPLQFPGLQRLGLRGVKSVSSSILAPFVLAFPSLTHLDLSGTRATPELLAVLGTSPTVRLHSFAIARCVLLTGESIKKFLVYSPVAAHICELSVYGDMTYSSPLADADIREIFNLAPCFASGELLYLDLSSSPLTKELLGTCKPQPKLRSLGLSYIHDLELSGVVEFLRNKSPNVEVVTLICTSPELDRGFRAGGPGVLRGSARQASLALHSQLITPLCTPPVFLHTIPSSQRAPPTHLRVIELSIGLLGSLGAGAGSWRIVRSKGGRGWYVDTASGWEGSVLRRDLEKDHPFRKDLEKLANASGNVSSGVGWHSRKMEILHGHGMLGREDGLYGAVSFAYQG